MKNSSALLCLILLIGCSQKPAQNATENSVQTDSSAPTKQNEQSSEKSELLITFTQKSCGIMSCPPKTIKIYDNKAMTLLDDTKSSHSVIVPESFNDLSSQLREINFAKQMKSYSPGGLGCKKYTSDGNEFELVKGPHKIAIYDGCMALPKSISNLLILLKKIMKSSALPSVDS